MKSKYSDNEAKKYISNYAKRGVSKDLALRIYTTQLLGNDPTVVLHGGGNTSVKSSIKTLLGNQEEIIYVKGSGKDMGNIEDCLLYTSPSPRDRTRSRMPSSA